ncbi:MAG: TetR/AcrR family transcriptional regulator [Chloroflexota bacterium]|nr:TetR/AcrR family transcriptional regulator [Chloroflexota bacterium]
MNKSNLNRHQRRSMRTREKLKQATHELLLENGYEMLSVKSITERADLGRGTFYLHFKDREDAVWALVEDSIVAADRQARDAYARGMQADTLQTLFLNVLRHTDQNRDLYRVILGAKGSAVTSSKVQDYLVEEFKRDSRDFGLTFKIPDIPLDVYLQLLVGAVVRLALWWLETPNDLSTEELASMISEVFS